MKKKYIIFLFVAITLKANSGDLNDLEPFNKHLLTKFDTLEIKKTYSYDVPSDELNNNFSQVKYEEKNITVTEICKKLSKTDQQNDFIIKKLNELSKKTDVFDMLLGNAIKELSEHKELIRHLEKNLRLLEFNYVELIKRN